MCNEQDHAQPSAERVARRAIVLASCAARGCLERSTSEEISRIDHERLPKWLEKLDLQNECETTEWDAITAPLGALSDQETVNLIWRAEGAVSLLWALKKVVSLPYDNYIQLDSLLSMIVFSEGADQLLSAPTLRPLNDIEHFADLYLMLHWRLREYRLHPAPLDFVMFARNCQWTIMPIESVQIIDDDLALRGKPISEAPYEVFCECMSCALERHHAANWLLGHDPVYSEVTTDT